MICSKEKFRSQIIFQFVCLLFIYIIIFIEKGESEQIEKVKTPLEIPVEKY